MTNLRMLRLHKGLSQEQLASRVGCCQGRISEIELGKGGVRYQLAKNLEREFPGWKLPDLLSEAEIPSRSQSAA